MTSEELAKLVAERMRDGFSRSFGLVDDSRDPDVITADEVAAILRLDRKTVYDYASRGAIPCRRIGKRMLFSREAIAIWLGSCSKRSSESSSK